MAGEAKVLHKFIMLSSRTSIESESAVFFTKPAETNRLQDFEKRNNTTLAYKFPPNSAI